MEPAEAPDEPAGRNSRAGFPRWAPKQLPKFPECFVIEPTGAIWEARPENDQWFTLRELHGFVGGYIEVLRLSEGRVLVVNEEGKIAHLPKNPKATLLASGESVLPPGDYIVGAVLVCPWKFLNEPEEEE